MHDYNSLYLWRQQAHTHVKDGDGDKLANLNEAQQLVPYEKPGMFAGFMRWRVQRHTDQLQTSWEQLTEEAERLGERVGIYEQIATKHAAKGWDELTIEELAESLDDLMSSPQVQLVKAKGALDDVCETCSLYLRGGKNEQAREQAFNTFAHKLEEVYQQLNQSVNDPQVNLQRLKELLENDVIHAFKTIGVDNDHPDSVEAKKMANKIDGIFKRFIAGHQQQIQQLRSQEPKRAPSPNSEEGMQIRLQHMLENLSNNNKPGADLNEQIRELDKQVPAITTVQHKPSSPGSDNAPGVSPSPQATGTSQTYRPPFDSREAGFQQRSTATSTQLRDAGLIDDQSEYAMLQQMIPPELFNHPNIVPQLRAFRRLQEYNPGFTLHDFVTLMKAWQPEDTNRWVQQMTSACQDYELMGPVKKTVKVLAWANRIPSHFDVVVDLLDMNALATPYIMDQLNTFAMFEHHLEGRVKFLTFESMAYLMNRNLLVPLHMGRMHQLKHNPEALLREYLNFSDTIAEAKNDTGRRMTAYEKSGASQYLTKFGVRPYQVPHNGDCF